MKRKFITIYRTGDILYWDCPNQCKQLHSLTLNAELPVTVICSCGAEYTISLMSERKAHSARILIEGDIK